MITTEHTWETGQAACEALDVEGKEGTYTLATIDSPGEQSWLDAVLPQLGVSNNDQLWFGAKYSVGEGDWRWFSTGAELGK